MYCKYESQEVSSNNIRVMLKYLQDKLIEIIQMQFLSYFFLSLREGESAENEDSDFEILLHFEAAIVAV